MGSLRCALEPRVYVAVGRAMWDQAGRELWEFVQGLSGGLVGGGMDDGDGMEGAWRARQRSGLALLDVNEFFVQRLALYDDSSMQVSGAAGTGGSITLLRLVLHSLTLPPTQERDLEPPSHVEMVQKLLQRSNAAINHAYTPI